MKIGAAAVLAAGPVAAIAAVLPAVDPDAELLELGRQFEGLYSEWLKGWHASGVRLDEINREAERLTGIRWEDRPQYGQPDPAGYYEVRDRLCRPVRPGEKSDEEIAAASGAIDEIVDKIENHRPRTLAGFSVWARAFAFCHCDLWEGASEEECPAQRLEIKMMEAICAAAGAPHPMQAVA